MHKHQQQPVAVERVTPGISSGLNAEQVQERMRAGLHNAPMPSLTRSIGRIFWDNIFTLFNIINAALALLIIWIGSFENLLFLGVAISNTLIGIFQEVRAKRSIDRLAIITQAKVRVVRGGQTEEIAPEALVLDDIMQVATGNQICADGVVLQSEGLEVDESALTGESKPVAKAAGERVLSGSFAVAGTGHVHVNAIGGESFVWKLSNEAKRKEKSTSELMRSLNAIIRALTMIIIPLGIALFITQQAKGMGLEASILGSTAAMIGMIPEGLVLLTGVALAVGAINLSQRQTLVQCLPCIETLARVDVLCLDKTGTITDGALTVSDIAACNGAALEDVEKAVSAVMRSLGDDNATARALRERFTAQADWTAVEKSPFSSARKWSGCTFANEGSYLLGAPEYLRLALDEQTSERISGYAADGQRVLALAHSEAPLSNADAGRTLRALIVLADHLRPEAKDTFAFFKAQGVAIKVISGDNAQTVSSVAARAGVENAEHYADMSTLQQADYSRLVEETTVFGRVSPHQKQDLVRALKRNGHVVAMTGDGVNDVLALKDADCSVAMASGSEAARDVSDVVLLSNNFDAMQYVVLEGRRVVNNIERVAALFLVKTAYSAMLTLLFIFLPYMFPFRPIQLAPTSALTVGIPSFFLALKPSYQRLQGKFLRNVLKISLPGAICIIFNILMVQFFGPPLLLTYQQMSTICVFMAGIVGFIVLLHVARPLDTPRKVMICLLLAVFVAIYLFFGRYFSLASMLSPYMVALYGPLLLASYPIFRLISRVSLQIVRAIRRRRRRAKRARP